MSELKPCPFCGEPFEIDDFNGFMVLHKKQDCPMSDYESNGWIYPNKETLISIMNTRPLEDALQTALDATKANRDWNHNRVLELQAKLDIAVEAIRQTRKELYPIAHGHGTRIDYAYECLEEALKKLE